MRRLSLREKWFISILIIIAVLVAVEFYMNQKYLNLDLLISNQSCADLDRYHCENNRKCKAVIGSLPCTGEGFHKICPPASGYLRCEKK